MVMLHLKTLHSYFVFVILFGRDISFDVDLLLSNCVCYCCSTLSFLSQNIEDGGMNRKYGERDGQNNFLKIKRFISENHSREF